MESTVLATVRQRESPLQVAPRRLAAAFPRAPDPRRAARVVYPVVAVLSLAVAAILANQRSEPSIARWGSRQPAERLRTLGFASGRTPCQSTLRRLFRKVDGQAVAEALRGHFASVAAPLPVAVGSQGVAFEGKAQRGRSPFQVGGSPVHALTSFCHERRGAPAQEPIERGEEKSEAELPVRRHLSLLAHKPCACRRRWASPKAGQGNRWSSRKSADWSAWHLLSAE